jgi:hypothetical protein
LEVCAALLRAVANLDDDLSAELKNEITWLLINIVADDHQDTLPTFLDERYGFMPLLN